MFDCVQRKGKSENKNCDNLEKYKYRPPEKQSTQGVYQGMRYTI